MVCRASGYYGTAFKAGGGVTQGGPLSAKLFNFLIDAVVREWIRESIAFAFKLVALTVIALVCVDQASKIAVIIATANLHVQPFAAWVACNLMKPTYSRL